MKKLSICLLLALAAPHAFADDGAWRFTIGAHNVDPKSGNGSLAGGTLDVDVDAKVSPTITAEYFFNESLGLEILASVPFKHDVELNGAHAGEITHLPPTISLQYHFVNESKWSPYVGAGVNFTWIYNEDSDGPIAGTDLDLDNSWGLALHAGLDYQLENNWFIGADLRWLDIDTDVSVDGVDVGSVHVDPLVYGFYLGKRF